MNEHRKEDATPDSQDLQVPRILARQMARELTPEELEEVSGAMMARGGYTATSICCDCDACDA